MKPNDTQANTSTLAEGSAQPSNVDPLENIDQTKNATQHSDGVRRLFKSTGLVSAMTMLSRILGFAREMIIAYLFGATAGVDAFIVAFKIPNFMRRLFAEGAFSQAFVPVLSEYRQTRDEKDIRAFVNHMFGTLGMVLLAVSIVAILIAPVLVRIFAPGFGDDSTRYTLATHMLRITFPYLLLISLTAFAGAVMNTYGRFGIPAFTPVLLNVSLIATALWLSPYTAKPIYALAWGVLIAGVVQLLFQLPFLKRLHLLPTRPWPTLRDPGVRRVLKLMVPALFGVSVAQINLLLDTIFASFLKVGSVSWLYYSDRLMTFPLGVFGVAIATVILPHLSRKFADQDSPAYSYALDWALQGILIIGVPSAVGLFILSGPLLATIFQHGHFNADDVMMTRQSLMAFAFGVPGFMLIKVLASGFYARQNIKTPVKVAAIAMVTNMCLNAALIVPLAHAGLALATTIAGVLNAGLLWWLLCRRGIYKPSPGWLKFLMRLVLANAVMAMLLVWFSGNLYQWLEWSWWQRAGHLALLVTMAVAAYFASLWACGFKWQLRQV